MGNAFNEEKERLEKVINFINQKIIEVQNKFEEQKNIRIGFSEGKKGTQFIRQAFMSKYATEENKLKSLIDKPYFARMDFKTDDEVTKIYLGKKGLVDDNQEVISCDWRSEIASMYYDYTLGTAEYEADGDIIKGEIIKKRQINIEKGKLLSVDEHDTITNDKILLKYLSENADIRLKNIIATIQREQNRVIRKPFYNNYIVQGVAGSGKTTVALHRIAYLLYNEMKKIEKKDFMILGPNNYFLDYISSLLPDLDIDNVKENTFESIALEQLGKIKIESKNKLLEKVLNKEKNPEIIKYKSSLEFIELLNNFIDFYIKTNLNKPLCLEGIELVGAENIQKFVGAYEGYQLNKNYGKNIQQTKKHIIKKIKEESSEISHKIWEKYREEFLSLDETDLRRQELLNLMDEVSNELKKGCPKLLNDYFKFINIKPLELYKIFIESLSTNIINAEINCNLLKEQTLETINKKRISNEDLAPLLIIKHFLTGIDNYKDYGYLVIDEGQDLSISEYYILKILFSNAKFNIYGDINQSIYAFKGINDWNLLNDVIFNSNSEIMELNKGYRTTKKIADTSNYILNALNSFKSETVAREGEEVFFGKNMDLINMINDCVKNNYKSIAIICKDNAETDKVYKYLTKLGISVSKICEDDLTYSGGISIMTPYLSKGLEFDAVILNDASELKYSSTSSIDMKLLYVAVTRALHKLYVNYSKEITYPLQKINDNKTKKLIKTL